MKVRPFQKLFGPSNKIKKIPFLERFQIARPFLILLESVLFIYVTTSTTISPDKTIRTILISWAVLGLLFLPLYRLCQKDLLVTFLFLSLISLGGFSTSQFFYAFVEVLALISLLAFIPAIFYKYKIDLRMVSYLFSLESFILLVLLIIFISIQFSSIPIASISQIYTNPLPYSLKISKPANLPDIYYLVMDGYGRSDMLDTLYQFDNSEFTSYLKTKGFIVPTQNHSNYAKTALSMATTLNMDYIENLAPGLEESHYWWLMTPLIENSRVRQVLEPLGYRTISIATDWDVTNNPSTNINPPGPIVINGFEWAMLSSTPIGFITPLLKKFSFFPSNESHRQLVRSGFQALETIPTISGPKFVIAHILVPHPPFLLDSDGNTVKSDFSFSFNDGSDNLLSDEEYRSKYIEQVEFTNSQLKKVIDSILQNSSTKPIIILQADHGPRMIDDIGPLDEVCLQEKFANFSAYYLPGVDPKKVPQDESNVNIFRIVLDSFFGADLPQLPNRSYYYIHPVLIYDSVDVTSQINDPCFFPASK